MNRRDESIPFERILVICVLGFLLGVLFGCTNPVAPIVCSVTGSDTTRSMPSGWTGDSITIIVTTEWCE